jgi:hydrogenase nickel insertion protein HypA
MHETTFVKEIIDVVNDRLKGLDTDSKICRINVRLSSFSHVSPERLRESFLQMASAGNLARVPLNINLSEVEIECKSCGSKFKVSEPLLICPHCKGEEFNIKKEPEFFVESIEIEQRHQVCTWYEACPLRIFYEQGKLPKKWIEDYCWGDNSKCVRKRMEEQGRYHPDNMLPDGTIDRKLI